MKLEDIIKLRNMTVFPICVNCTMTEQRIIKRVYPLMQKQILSILRIPFPSDVEIILFGSSLTMQCNIYSDIDLAIKTANYDIDMFHSVREN